MQYCNTNDIIKAKIIYMKGHIDIHDNNENIFMTCCKNGQLELAQWIYSLGELDNYENEAFKITSVNGHLAIMQWLYSLGNINMIAINYAFKQSCYKGYFLVVKWILGMKLEIENIDKIFEMTCYNGQLDVAKYIYDKYKSNCINTELIINDLIRLCCTTKHTNIIKWLCTLYEIETSMLVYIFNTSCNSGNIDLVEYIFNLEETCEITNEIFINCCVQGYIDILQWIFSIYNTLNMFIGDDFNYESCHPEVKNWLKIFKI